MTLDFVKDRSCDFGSDVTGSDLRTIGTGPFCRATGRFLWTKLNKPLSFLGCLDLRWIMNVLNTFTTLVFLCGEGSVTYDQGARSVWQNPNMTVEFALHHFDRIDFALLSGLVSNALADESLCCKWSAL